MLRLCLLKAVLYYLCMYIIHLYVHRETMNTLNRKMFNRGETFLVTTYILYILPKCNDFFSYAQNCNALAGIRTHDILFCGRM
jgi:hypothetical protein